MLCKNCDELVEEGSFCDSECEEDYKDFMAKQNRDDQRFMDEELS
jgi:hypothetical protein